MGSYMSTNQNSKNLISYETLLWLKKQLWAWILLGIFIMSVFFYIAKGLIVFIGGISLGVYLYNKFGKDDNYNNNNNNNNNSNNVPEGVGEQIFSNTMGLLKNGITNILPKNENFINFNNNKLFNNMWWKNTR